jgi:hypothetical protein
MTSDKYEYNHNSIWNEIQKCSVGAIASLHRRPLKRQGRWNDTI